MQLLTPSPPLHDACRRLDACAYSAVASIPVLPAATLHFGSAVGHNAPARQAHPLARVLRVLGLQNMA